MVTQLRDYRILDGTLEEFVEEWRNQLVPIRVGLGFTIDGAWTVKEDGRFVWLLTFPGDWDAFEEADARYFASPDRKGLDPDPARLIEAQANQRLRPRDVRLHLIEGSSSDSSIISSVEQLVGPDGLDVVLIDGDHSYEGAMSDFEAYRPLVRPGGVIAFHDIVPDSRTRGGPDTGTYTGDVPVVWKELSAHADNTWEFVRSYDQDGYGIGVLEAKA